MDVENCFYDDLATLLSSPNGYGISSHDFHENITSAETSFDSHLLHQSRGTPLNSASVYSDLFQSTPEGQYDFEINFDDLSVASPNLWSEDQSPLTSLVASEYSSHCNNSYNDKDISNFTLDNMLDGIETRDNQNVTQIKNNKEINKLTCKTPVDIQNRDTPSPTESCGSSTSGIHSDSSEGWQNMQKQNHGFDPKIKDSIKNQFQFEDSLTLAFDKKKLKCTINSSPIENFQKNQITETNISCTNPTPIYVDQTILAHNKESDGKQDESSTKGVKKNKTIFLSPNDYKALMLKMNMNGQKGVKLNGNAPNIVIKNGIGNFIKQQNESHDPRRLNRNGCIKTRVQQSTQNLNEATCLESDFLIRTHNSKINEKIYKKQQRMIKNRQSASLSRKKKKEYVVSLETRISNLEIENNSLKRENTSLHKQLVAFAKTCKCQKSGVCDYVLNSLHSTSRSEQHIKIAPKPPSKGIRQHVTAATVKKNVAVLFAMAFMVTLNAGNFQSYLTKQKLDIDSSTAVTDLNSNDPIPITRRLLWVGSEEEHTEKLNGSNKLSNELVVPPLHFLQPNITKKENFNTTNSSKFKKGNDPPPLTYSVPPKCNHVCTSFKSNGNQSEFTRLELNLEKLINVSGYLNLSMNTNLNEEQDISHDLHFSTHHLEIPKIGKQIPKAVKRKIVLSPNERFFNNEHKQQKLDRIYKNEGKNMFYNSEHFNLLKGINRQEDTLYVFSFNMDNILLSPLKKITNLRPKISILLPTAEPSPNGDIAMMQVDCEVFDTKELTFNSNMIPSRLRQNLTKWQTKRKQASIFNRTLGKNREQETLSKLEKPRVRTFFMVGPKNQADAALSNEKPQLVEFNKNMINSSKIITAHLDP